MKLLYDNKCQVCEFYSQLPTIVMEDGKYYCEMHHIKPVKSFNGELSANDKSNIRIGHYQNSIVVCPHHHKIIIDY